MDNNQTLLTAQDIQDVQFNKSLGGYKTNEVDEFLDRCAETVDALTRTNADNEHKMQVLGQSVMDYRAQEDTIRNALLNAQRMSDTILGEARQQAEQIIAQASEQAAHIHETAESDVQAERAELKRVQDEVAAFKARLLSIYREHLTLIGVLTEDEPTKSETETSVSDSPSDDATIETHTVVDSKEEAADTTAPENTSSSFSDSVAPQFDLSQFSLDEE